METPFLWELISYALFVVALIHSLKVLGKSNTLILFLSAILWGWSLEFAAMHFFNRYQYSAHYLFYVLNVPLHIALGWSVIIYFGYWLATKKLHLQKLTKIDLTAITAGITIDVLILEPLAYIYRFWTWTPESLWFGSPIGNILGWLISIGLFITSYRLITSHVKSNTRKLMLMVAGVPINIVFLLLLLKAYGVLFGNL